MPLFKYSEKKLHLTVPLKVIWTTCIKAVEGSVKLFTAAKSTISESILTEEKIYPHFESNASECPASLEENAPTEQHHCVLCNSPYPFSRSNMNVCRTKTQNVNLVITQKTESS